MTSPRRTHLSAAGQRLRPTVHVGKEGVTEAVEQEILRQLRRNRLVKVRLLPSVEQDPEVVAERLVRASGAVLVELRGRTVLLAKE